MFESVDEILKSDHSNESYKPLSLRGHVESQENKKFCYCTESVAQMRIQCEACHAKTKLFILLGLNMDAE